MKVRYLAIGLFAVLLVSAACTSKNETLSEVVTQDPCDRECLEDFVDQYAKKIYKLELVSEAYQNLIDMNPVFAKELDLGKYMKDKVDEKKSEGEGEAEKDDGDAAGGDAEKKEGEGEAEKDGGDAAGGDAEKKEGEGGDEKKEGDSEEKKEEEKK